MSGMGIAYVVHVNLLWLKYTTLDGFSTRGSHVNFLHTSKRIDLKRRTRFIMTVDIFAIVVVVLRLLVEHLHVV